MPRQTYISKDFFVNASEREAKNCILQLPEAVSNIKFVAEDPVRHSLKFVYEGEDELPDNLVDVALLPLSIDQTRVTLYGSYTDGASIYKANEVSSTLQNFETAINAAVKGTLNDFQPRKLKIKSMKKTLKYIMGLSILSGVVYLMRK